MSRLEPDRRQMPDCRKPEDGTHGIVGNPKALFECEMETSRPISAHCSRPSTSSVRRASSRASSLRSRPRLRRSRAMFCVDRTGEHHRRDSKRPDLITGPDVVEGLDFYRDHVAVELQHGLGPRESRRAERHRWRCG